MFLRQSTSQAVKIGPFLDSTDGVTAEQSLTIANTDIQISKDGGNYANKNSGGATHDEDGEYDITLDATDTNTVGLLRVKSFMAGAVPVWHEWYVVEESIYDALFAASAAGFDSNQRVDVGSWLGTAAATPTVAGVPEVDVTHLGGAAQSATDLKDFADAGYDPATNKVEGVKLVDTTTTNTDMRGTDGANTTTPPTAAAIVNEWESQSQADPTGFHVNVLEVNGTAQTAGDIAAKIDGIGAASGGSLNFANEGDNVDSAIKSISFDGVETSGTNASVNFEDAVYHQIDDAANNIDVVYQFDVGGGRTAVEVTWKGRLVGTNDTMLIQAYNGSTWDTIKTVPGQSNSAPSTVSDNATETIPLLSTHTGTGADLGKVFIRLECASGSNPTIYTDLLLVAAVNIGQSVGYANGAVWLDTNASNTGTESFVDGVADNPVSTIAAALTIAGNVGLKRLEVASGSSVTAAASLENYTLIGHNWTLAFGGQTFTDAQVIGATVSGTFAGTSVILEDCIINAITGPGLTMRRCFFNDVTITNNGTAGWFMNDCRSRVAGAGARPNFDFGALVGDTGLNMRSYSGGIELENMGGAGTDTASIEGFGNVVLNANCSGGDLAIRGMFNFTDNASGAVTVKLTSPVVDIVDQGKAQGGSATTITLASTASATNGQYDPGVIIITAGAGQGQARGIIDYNGTSKVAVVDKDWRTNPDSTSSYVVMASAGKNHVNEGQAQAGAASTITLNTAGSSTDDIYIGQTIFLVAGTGQDQSRIVTDYNGTTKVATVHRAWDVTPDATTSYLMLPLPAIGDTINNLDARIPAALVSGKMDSDVTAISGSTEAADKLEAHALETLPVTFTGGTTTTAVLGNVDSAAASSTDDVYIGRILIFNTGTLDHQVAEITDYVGSTKTATISAVTTAVTSSHTARMV